MTGPSTAIALSTRGRTSRTLAHIGRLPPPRQIRASVVARSQLAIGSMQKCSDNPAARFWISRISGDEIGRRYADRRCRFTSGHARSGSRPLVVGWRRTSSLAGVCLGAGANLATLVVIVWIVELLVALVVPRHAAGAEHSKDDNANQAGRSCRFTLVPSIEGRFSTSGWDRSTVGRGALALRPGFSAQARKPPTAHRASRGGRRGLLVLTAGSGGPTSTGVIPPFRWLRLYPMSA